MNYTFKGLMYSGLIFPGSGHIVLKRTYRGLPFLFSATGGLVTLVVQSSRIALEMVSKLEPVTGQIDLSMIMNIVDQAMASVHSTSFNLAFMIILASWVLGMVDVFFIGRQMDTKEKAVPPLPDI
ncbi:MAG: hypothetical protein KKD44_18145 [Proteobacteria bacterium]|nr:hypothetical protein [Pseudomonadota bacterium]